MAHYTDRDYDHDWDYDRDWDYERRSDYEPGSYGRNRNLDRYDYQDRRRSYDQAGYSERNYHDRIDHGEYNQRDYDRSGDRYGQEDYRRGRFEEYDRGRIEDRSYNEYDRFQHYRDRNEDPGYDRDRNHGPNFDRDYGYSEDRDQSVRRRACHEAPSRIGDEDANREQDDDRRQHRGQRYEWRREYEPNNVW